MPLPSDTKIHIVREEWLHLEGRQAREPLESLFFFHKCFILPYFSAISMASSIIPISPTAQTTLGHVGTSCLDHAMSISSLHWSVSVWSFLMAFKSGVGTSSHTPRVNQSVTPCNSVRRSVIGTSFSWVPSKTVTWPNNNLRICRKTSCWAKLQQFTWNYYCYTDALDDANCVQRMIKGQLENLGNRTCDTQYTYKIINKHKLCISIVQAYLDAHLFAQRQCQIEYPNITNHMIIYNSSLIVAVKHY